MYVAIKYMFYRNDNLAHIIQSCRYDLTKRRLKANCGCKFSLLYGKPIHHTRIFLTIFLSTYCKIVRVRLYIYKYARYGFKNRGGCRCVYLCFVDVCFASLKITKKVGTGNQISMTYIFYNSTPLYTHSEPNKR